MKAPLLPIQAQSVRHYFTLRILCLLGVVSGYSGLAEGQPAEIRCPSTVKTTISAAKPTVNVSYTEPKVDALGKQLDNLAKTTIYYDLGDGRRQAKVVKANNPRGGEPISETISVPIGTQGEQVVRICATATNTDGMESAMTP